MKNYFWINCDTVMDELYESERDEPLPLLTQLRTGLHLFFCAGCSAELKNLQQLEKVMKTEFFPPSPDFENSIMQRLYEEPVEEEKAATAAGPSIRGWVIIGIFMLLSFASAFFGGNFIEVADKEGLSFLLPVGITIGIVLTCYGALFIGSHLKELSMRFRLH